MSRGCRLLVLLALLALLQISARDATAEEGEFRETFEAVAMAMGTSNPPIIPRGTRTTIQINITRWSTDKQRQKLLTELRDNGQQGLVSTLRREEETGWVRVTGRGSTRTRFPSERLRYARQIELGDGARRIVLALDRPISFAEAAQRPRWRDHDMTLIVLDVDRKGEGEGQLAMGVRLELDDQNNLTVENFGTEPVRLTRVRRR